MRRTTAAAPLLAVALAVVLAGCGGSLTQTVGDSVWITPNKYQFHDCKLLIGLEAGNLKRTKDLEDLMAKAAQSPGGGMIGTLAYRTEYQQALGERRQIETTIGEKRCRTDRESVSSKSVF